MTISTDDLLFEIGMEELPPLAVKSLGQALAEMLHKHLTEAQIQVGDYVVYATPRRLAVHFTQVTARQPRYDQERKGPMLSNAFDASGNPTPAALGFAKSCGIPLEKLKKHKTETGGWLLYRKTERGKTLRELLPQMIQKTMQTLPISKRMRWGTHKESFVRPIHWVLLLYGGKIIPLELFGIRSNRYTYGHRFFSNKRIQIAHPKAYEAALEQTGFVIPSFEKRRTQILNHFTLFENTLAGTVDKDTVLLDEVTSLVEYPSVQCAEFDSRFLQIPQEILISSMKHHQRCFPMMQNNRLLPTFLIVTNSPGEPSPDIQKGNERVMHARLADAEFFYQQDLKIPFSSRLESLKNITFQAKLGNLFEKSHRIATLAKHIAEHSKQANGNTVYEAGLLAKADLVTDVVKEFPELQGIIGAYYANVTVIREHYLPRTAADALPTSAEGICLAIADRLDTLVGIFGVHLIPTGDKDPYGLRRAALGILRIALEKHWSLDLQHFIHLARTLYTQTLADDTEKLVFQFILERFRAWYAELQVPTAVVNAVLAKKPVDPLDVEARITALATFTQLPEAAPLSQAHKRVNNILSKSGADLSKLKVVTDLLQEPAEKKLALELEHLQQKQQVWSEQKAYQESLMILAKAKEPIDHFFDTVLVMTSDVALKNNRLALLVALRNVLTSVAELSLLS